MIIFALSFVEAHIAAQKCYQRLSLSFETESSLTGYAWDVSLQSLSATRTSSLLEVELQTRRMGTKMTKDIVWPIVRGVVVRQF